MARTNWSFLFALCLLWATGAVSQSPVSQTAAPSYGALAGFVVNSAGTAQVGVPVTVTRHDGRFVKRVYTGSNGRFTLARLLPGLYAAEVLLPSFLPFFEAIPIQPGAAAMIQIDLRTLADSIKIGFPEDPASAREDWKWVLRTAAPVRPVLRFLEEDGKDSPTALRDLRERALRGTVQFSAGNASHGYGADPGMRTAFAVDYELTGASTVGLAGSAGWERGTPSAGFRAAWSRHSPNGTASAFSATVRQLFLPAAYGTATDSPLQEASGRRAQSVTLGYEDDLALGERVRFHYGALIDTLSLGERISRWSPFGRLTYLPDEHTRLVVAYTAAAPRVLPSGFDPNRQKMDQLMTIPQVSSGDGMQPVLEGGRHVEASIERNLGPYVVVEAAGFYDSLTNTALALAVREGTPVPAGLLQDPFSNRYFLSGGDSSSPGARAAAAVQLPGDSQLVVGYSYAGGLRTISSELAAENLQDVRNMVESVRGSSVVVKLNSTAPWTRTRVLASYRWMQEGMLIPGDSYNRGFGQADPYLSVVLLQPLPSPDILPGQFQAVADFSNLLAQGYLPVYTPTGAVGSYLFPSARSFRGGVNFIF